MTKAEFATLKHQAEYEKNHDAEYQLGLWFMDEDNKRLFNKNEAKEYFIRAANHHHNLATLALCDWYIDELRDAIWNNKNEKYINRLYQQGTKWAQIGIKNNVKGCKNAFNVLNEVYGNESKHVEIVEQNERKVEISKKIAVAPFKATAAVFSLGWIGVIIAIALIIYLFVVIWYVGLIIGIIILIAFIVWLALRAESNSKNRQILEERNQQIENIKLKNEGKRFEKKHFETIEEELSWKSSVPLHNTKPLENEQVGILGECYYEWLIKKEDKVTLDKLNDICFQKLETHIKQITWCHDTVETMDPFDFKIECENGQFIFIDIKTSFFNNRNIYLSQQQKEFAEKTSSVGNLYLIGKINNFKYCNVSQFKPQSVRQNTWIHYYDLNDPNDLTGILVKIKENNKI